MYDFSKTRNQRNNWFIPYMHQEIAMRTSLLLLSHLLVFWFSGLTSSTLSAYNLFILLFSRVTSLRIKWKYLADVKQQSQDDKW